MFLFRRKKNTEEKTAPVRETVKERKLFKPVIKDGQRKELFTRRTSPTAYMRRTAAGTTQLPDDDMPVKVVIPASALEEDAPEDVELEKESLPVEESLPEEDVDGLLEKVNQNRAAESEVDIELSSIMPSQDEDEPAEVPPQAETAISEEKSSKQEKAQKAVQPVQSSQPAQPVQIEQPTQPVQVIQPVMLVQPVQAAQPAAGSAEVPAENAEPAPDASPAPAEEKPAAEADKSKKPDEDDSNGNLFSSLFGKTAVEEESPLDRLINALPDISISEVMNEAEEFKGLMDEWFQSQCK
jgi:hypothetical protein